jgi:hypothetical protein
MLLCVNCLIPLGSAGKEREIVILLCNYQTKNPVASQNSTQNGALAHYFLFLMNLTVVCYRCRADTNQVTKFPEFDPSREACQSLSLSRISKHFLEPESSISSSQVSSIGHYFEPDQTIPYHHMLSLSYPF